jgi:hypothetical protein
MTILHHIPIVEHDSGITHRLEGWPTEAATHEVTFFQQQTRFSFHI